MELFQFFNSKYFHSVLSKDVDWHVLTFCRDMSVTDHVENTVQILLIKELKSFNIPHIIRSCCYVLRTVRFALERTRTFIRHLCACTGVPHSTADGHSQHHSTQTPIWTCECTQTERYLTVAILAETKKSTGNSFRVLHNTTCTEQFAIDSHRFYDTTEYWQFEKGSRKNKFLQGIFLVPNNLGKFTVSTRVRRTFLS